MGVGSVGTPCMANGLPPDSEFHPPRRYNRTCEFRSGAHRGPLRRGWESLGWIPAVGLPAGIAGRHPAGLGIPPRSAGFCGGGELLPEPCGGDCSGGGSGAADDRAARTEISAGFFLRAFLRRSGLPGRGFAAALLLVAGGRPVDAGDRRRALEYGAV